jgi:hypothetical protein
MKLEWVVDFRCNKLEAYFIVNMIIAVAAIVCGVFFDTIGGKFTLRYNQGFGIYQILWVGAWGMYLLWTVANAKEWGE